MLITGNQLKAARALAGVDQHELADSAGINVNTIRNMEARGAEPITSSAVTVRKVQLALEARGIEFLNHALPGVRLSKGAAVPQVEIAGVSNPKRGARRARRKSNRATRK